MNDTRRQFDRLVELFAAGHNEDSVEVKDLGRQITTPLVVSTLVSQVMRYRAEGREEEIPEQYRSLGGS